MVNLVGVISEHLYEHLYAHLYEHMRPYTRNRSFTSLTLMRRCAPEHSSGLDLSAIVCQGVGKVFVKEFVNVFGEVFETCSCSHS